MAKKKLTVSNERMLKLMNWAIVSGKVGNESEYCERIKYQKKNLINIKNGHQGFTIAHIISACKYTGASADWIFGLTTEMMRKPGKKPIDQLKEAVMAVELQLTKPLTVT